MKLEEFLIENNIALSTKPLKLCNSGLKKMSLASDKSHGLYHIFHILDNLNYLINKNVDVKMKINFDILLLAICWHDVWISGQNPKNIAQIMYFQVVEGKKSAKMFEVEARKRNLDLYLIGMVKYVIRKHSSFQLLPAFVLEAKILFDLDKIELWNHKRFFKLGTELVAKREFFQKYLVRFYFNYSEKMGLYFKDLESKFRKNSIKFWKEILK